MGDPKSRKRKSKTVDAEDQEPQILELPVDEVHEREERKTKTKKNKKSKVLEESTNDVNGGDEIVNESEENKPKTKKNKKTKVLEVSTDKVNDGDEIVNENEEYKPKSKKNKKSKVLEVSTEEVNDADEAVNESKENKPKTKKHKKTKVLETSTELVADSEENETKPKKATKNKALETTTEELNESDSKEGKAKRAKKHKLPESTEEGENDVKKQKPKKAKKQKNPRDIRNLEVPEELIAQYPVLADKALEEKLMAVSIKTHLRTRLRQQLKKKFIKTSAPKLPEAIHSHLQDILKLPEQSENDLRRVRLLVNMLKTELLLPGSFQKIVGGDEEKKVNGAEGVKSIPVENLKLPEEVVARYPVLADGELVARFRAVDYSNNKKGRVRQILKESLKGTSESLLPDAIHSRMQNVLQTPVSELGGPALRKLRILYNMLRTALQASPAQKQNKPKEKKEKKQKKQKSDENEDSDEEKEKDDKQKEQKVKGPKRYVVFVGNLPLDIKKEKLSEHFSDLGDRLKDVRVPKPAEGKKSAIAYLEVADELSFELALSKHHSMLDNKRINVLYTTQQNSKVSKTEAKGKAAKLVAMQKAGKLAGSIPLNKKRSARRNKMKAAQKKEQEAMEHGA